MYKRETGMTSFFVTVIGASAGTPLCDRRTKLLLVELRSGCGGGRVSATDLPE